MLPPCRALSPGCRSLIRLPLSHQLALPIRQERADGSVVDFSYLKCLDKLFPSMRGPGGSKKRGRDGDKQASPSKKAAKSQDDGAADGGAAGEDEGVQNERDRKRTRMNSTNL